MARKTNKKATPKSVLAQLSESQIRTFIGKMLNKPVVKTAFLNEFEDYFIEEDSADTYLDQIDDAYYDAIEEYGYIPFREQSHLSSKIYNVLEAAERFRDKGNHEAAIEICFCVLRNNVSAINNTDDSYGYLGGIMDKALDGVNALADSSVCKLSEDSRQLFMDKCWECIRKKSFDGWDWHADMYDLLATLAKDESECRKISKALEKDEAFERDYYKRRKMHIMRQLVAKSKGDEAAQEFELQNLNIQEFREKAIREAIESSNFARAYQLCEDGIKQDLKDRPGIVPTWHNWMLKAAQKDGRKDIITEYASLLYLDGFNIQGDFYALLKQTVPHGEWTDFATKLSERALEMNRKEKYADICSREGWTAKLFEYVKSEKSIHPMLKY